MTPRLDIEVLIVGAGIAGLWLAHDLADLGIPFAVLERAELGGAQTCHSHVYIHQGFIYNRVDLIKELLSVTATWQAWLQNRPHLILSHRSHFGFRHGEEFQQKLALWSEPSLGLRCEPVDPSLWPAALAPGAV